MAPSNEAPCVRCVSRAQRIHPLTKTGRIQAARRMKGCDEPQANTLTFLSNFQACLPFPGQQPQPIPVGSMSHPLSESAIHQLLAGNALSRRASLTQRQCGTSPITHSTLRTPLCPPPLCPAVWPLGRDSGSSSQDFLMWTIFKVFVEFVTVLLLFRVLVFWPRGMWGLSSLPGIEYAPPALEGEVLTTGPPEKSQDNGSHKGNPFRWQ